MEVILYTKDCLSISKISTPILYSVTKSCEIISFGQYTATALQFMPLYIEQSGDLDRCYQCLTHNFER